MTWASEPLTADAFREAFERSLRPREPQPIYVSQETYDLIVDQFAEAERMADRQSDRRDALAGVTSHEEIRRFFGWTRKRWVRERKRHNRKRPPHSWRSSWADGVAYRAEAGLPPWYLRNTKESRAQDAERRRYEADTYDERSEW